MKEMKLKLSVLFLLVALLGLRAIAQSQREIEELYRDANSFFYFEDYEEALALYLNIHGFQPNNSNLEYRIGVCYLNIPGSKHKAIGYLELAAANISRRYNENSLFETGAPPDALFYLANAYFINNQLGKAEETYYRFHKTIKSESRYNMAYFNHQLASLKSSRVQQSYPVDFIRENLGEPINDRFSNFNPVVSGNGKVLAYTTKRRFQNVIFVARWDDKGWGAPRNITLDLVVDGNCSTLSLSHTGNELYLFRDDAHDGNIYISYFQNGGWTPIHKLNPHINSPSYETHAVESPDGKKLYFTSNKPGGFGDLDIYVSERLPHGDWGAAVNLGSNINTRFNENAPFLADGGNMLFFSSEDHGTMGGYDIFFSQLQANGQWSKPINAGFPLNSTDDDLFFQPMGNGSFGLMAAFDDDGFGEMDIYGYDIFLPKYQKSMLSSGDLVAQKTKVFPKTILVDTTTAPGFALLDPTKLENPAYLDPFRKVKLFFAGKKYDIKEMPKFEFQSQPELAHTLLKSESGKKTTEKVTSLEIGNQDLLKSHPQATTNGTPDAKKDTGVGLDESIFSGDTVSEARRGQTKRFLFADSLRMVDLRRNLDMLTNIMLALAPNDLKPMIANALSVPMPLPAHMALHLTSRVSKLADSVLLHEPLIGLFARLADMVGSQNDNSGNRQPRSILVAGDNFFHQVQRLKQKASPGLAFFLDQLIIGDPSINSFEALWDYIQKNSREELQPLKQEFVELIAQFAFESFYGLTQEQKEGVLLQVTVKQPNKLWFIPSAILLLGLLILLLRIRKNRKKRKTD